MIIYPGGDIGAGEFSIFVGDNVGEEFIQNVIRTDIPAQKFQTILLAIQAGNREPELLTKLMAEHVGSTEIVAIHNSVRDSLGDLWPNSLVRQRHLALKSNFLMCKGFPFIDRRTLSQTLDNLLDDNNPMRVGVVTGVELCGKTWVRHLLQSKCDAFGCSLIDLDLEQIAPGDDAKLVCELLMRQMAGRDDVSIREQDTTSGQYIQRIAYEVGELRRRMLQIHSDTKPLVIGIDSLNKCVGDSVLDFVEQLVAATRTQSLAETKIVLIGFPRDSSRFGFTAREIISPLTEPDISDYLAEVARIIGSQIKQDERDDIARHAIAMATHLPHTSVADKLCALGEMSRYIHGHIEQMIMADAV